MDEEYENEMLVFLQRCGRQIHLSVTVLWQVNVAKQNDCIKIAVKNYGSFSCPKS